MLLNNNELAAVKDCLKRYIEFNNNGLMSSYKVKQIYRIIKRYSNKTHKMLLPTLEVIGSVEND